MSITTEQYQEACDLHATLTTALAEFEKIVKDALPDVHKTWVKYGSKINNDENTTVSSFDLLEAIEEEIKDE